MSNIREGGGRRGTYPLYVCPKLGTCACGLRLQKNRDWDGRKRGIRHKYRGKCMGGSSSPFLDHHNWVSFEKHVFSVVY